jgi:hypothetical protein
MPILTAPGAPDNPPTDEAAAYHRERVADGAACLEAALRYLNHGWPVLALCPPDHIGVGREHGRACKTPGKRPWHAWKQYQDKQPTEAEVRCWWRSLPNSNVGMALGRMLRIDTDGPAGEDLLRRWSGGDLPPTLEFTGDTTKGGRGLLYLAPPGVALRSTSEVPREGQELRLQGLGAQTVLPPSRHPKGMLYRWKRGHGIGEIAPAPAPEWLVQRLLAQAIRRPHRSTTRSPGVTTARATAAVALALDALEQLGAERAVAYDSWLHVGMALHAIDPSAVMLAAWNEWSQQCEHKHQPGVCEAKWATFHQDGGLGLSDLLRWARQDSGWEPELGQAHICSRAARRRHPRGTIRFSFVVEVGP